MIQKVTDIMDKNFMKVSILDGVRHIQDIFYKNSIEYFAVYEFEKLVGIVTKKELVRAHPNRIIADAMSENFKSINYDTPIWMVKEILDFNDNIDVIFVEDKEVITGFVTRAVLNIELNKHIDLLTGLYKSEYIFYNAYNLINNQKEASIIFIDLDNFGHIDKKYGHIFGDMVLKIVANVLKDNIPEDTYLCRYAGDEFAILAPYSAEKCRLFAEKLIDNVKSYEFPNKIPVSASIGITSCKIDNKKTDNILNLIKRLINIASLASTKAKESVDKSVVIGDFDANAIA